MPNLNFYDTDAVKAFVLNILVENEELRSSLDFERKQSNAWFRDFQAQKERADAADAKITDLEKTAEALAAERDAALSQRGGADQ